jgi:excisionase family DNA binding protein
MAAVGNLNDYVKYQMAEGMAKGGGGPGGTAAEIAMGFGMAKDMMGQGFLTGQSTAPAGGPAGAPAPAPVAAPTMLTPAQVAEQLGVSEADVISTLEAGDLKGKKIGTQWRVSSEALTEFLKH